MKKILTIIGFALALCVYFSCFCVAFADTAQSESAAQEQGADDESSGGVLESSVALVAVGGGGALAVSNTKRKKTDGTKKNSSLYSKQSPSPVSSSAYLSEEGKANK